MLYGARDINCALCATAALYGSHCCMAFNACMRYLSGVCDVSDVLELTIVCVVLGGCARLQWSYGLCGLCSLNIVVIRLCVVVCVVCAACVRCILQ